MADRIHRPPSESGKRKITVKYTPTDQEKFLTEFAKSGNLSRAARIAGVNRQIHYEWLLNPEYAAGFVEAHSRYKEYLEEELHQRATVGAEEDVWYQGQKVGKTRRKSDILLMFSMKKHIPEYRDNSTTNVSLTADIQANVSIDLSKLSQDQLDALDTLYLAASSDRSAAERNAAIDCSGKAETVAEPDS
jgi:hypothetical protein